MASRYEIQFSDAARSDFDRLQSEAESCAESSSDALRQLLEVHALLDQVADGDPAGDSVLPLSSPETALRYRSEGGVYLYFRREEETRTAMVMFFCEGQADQSASSAPSAAPQLTDLRIRDIPHGLESESGMEFTGEDGSKRRMRSFVRKVDWGDSYAVFNHFALDGQPSRT